jgi:thioredoxin reductase (NADPH)
MRMVWLEVRSWPMLRSVANIVNGERVMNSSAPSALRDAEPDQTDVYDREAQMFPRLSEEMVRRIAAYGEGTTLAAGTLAFERGQRSVDMFLVLDGAIEVFAETEQGERVAITTHTARQFSGELDHFNDRAVLVSARTLVDSRVVRVGRAAFRRLVTGEPDIGEVMMRAFILRRVGLFEHGRAGAVLVGPAHSAATLRLQRFLVRNYYPHRTLDTDTDPDAGSFLACFEIETADLPVVIAARQRLLRNPTAADLADALGLTETFDPERIYDVVIVGAGPAGRATAVYAASEGLDTLVIEGVAPGGQAGTSSKIENYLGFPTGISGQALAGRAQVQAQKFGARLAIARPVTGIDCNPSPFGLRLDGESVVRARSVVIASGARYRRLEVPGHERFEGQGLHYAATAMEAQLCAGEPVIVVGGGNSAGQAAMFLSRTSEHVHMVVRAPGLAATMSDYLVRRIETSPRITVRPRAEITALDGDERLRVVTLSHHDTGAADTLAVGNVFLMIGADPNTDWLDGCLDLDADGFVKTGHTAGATALVSPYQTSRPGVFAVGDVRSGSVKRVASSVGEGSVVVHAVHRFLRPDHD